MNQIAYDNLKLLDTKYSDSLLLMSDNNILSLIEKDDFDTCSQIKFLEYPLYFTYHQILNIIQYDNDISYKNKRVLLSMIDNSLDNLIDYINDYEEENDTLLTMIDDIFSRTEKVTEDTKYNSTLERFIYFFDDMVDMFRLANKYLYFSQNIHSPLMNLMPGHYVEDEGECDSDEEDDKDQDQDELDDQDDKDQDDEDKDQDDEDEDQADEDKDDEDQDQDQDEEDDQDDEDEDEDQDDEDEEDEDQDDDDEDQDEEDEEDEEDDLDDLID